MPQLGIAEQMCAMAVELLVNYVPWLGIAKKMYAIAENCWENMCHGKMCAMATHCRENVFHGSPLLGKCMPRLAIAEEM